MNYLYAAILVFILTKNLRSQVTNLDVFIPERMEIRNIPGLAACVVKNQEMVWANAYGLADIENNIPVTTETLFTVASISKLFVATAIMQLYEEGLIDLNTDINDYLDYDIINPNFPNDPITVRMLLEHKSSLKDPEGQMYNYQSQGDYDSDISTFIQNIITPTGNNYQGWYFSDTNNPGAVQLYSNIGFTILAVIIEHVKDMPYHQFVKENIFDPLCMDNTSFFFSDLENNEIAKPYKWENNNHVLLGYYGIALYPSALIKTNVLELSKFLIAYTGRGTIDGVKILESSSVDLLTPYDFSLDNLGWWNGTYWTFTFHAPDDEVWFHGGYMPGIRTRMNYYPSDSTGIIILTNGEGQYSPIEDELVSEIINFNSTSPDELACNSTSIFNPNQERINFFPNPSNGILKSEFNNFTDLNVYDVNGKNIKFEANENELRIDQKGIFIVEFKVEGELFYQKICVQ